MTDPQTAPQASATLDDSRGGLALFLIFTAAVLIVTGAVVLVALVGAWWMLGFAFAIHIVMTTIVVVTIVAVMDGRAGTSAERAQADGGRRDTRTPARAKPVAAL